MAKDANLIESGFLKLIQHLRKHPEIVQENFIICYACGDPVFEDNLLRRGEEICPWCGEELVGGWY